MSYKSSWQTYSLTHQLFNFIAIKYSTNIPLVQQRCLTSKMCSFLNRVESLPKQVEAVIAAKDVLM